MKKLKDILNKNLIKATGKKKQTLEDTIKRIEFAEKLRYGEKG